MTSHKDTISTSDLVENYGQMVSSICRRMIYDEEVARDTAQEIWLEIMKSLPSFRGDSKVSTWIYTIACRVAARRARAERTYSARVLRGTFEAERDLPVSHDFDRKLWVKAMCDKCLTGILHCLNNKTRMAYILRDIAQLPYADIAEILGQNAVSIRQMVVRARRKLKNFLEDQCVLYNPHGQCACRMDKWMNEVDLSRAGEELRKSVARIDAFWKSYEIASRLNYWEQYL
ncbi:MAG: sigma-70 family RNA polymerase sigma factor [Chloroflexi bacterium]|nr:sigma-70 family RNA polymerase sigma factor [Chloroflexota bacterium]